MIIKHNTIHPNNIHFYLKNVFITEFGKVFFTFILTLIKNSLLLPVKLRLDSTGNNTL